MIGEKTHLSLLPSSFFTPGYVGNYSLGKLQSEEMVGGEKERGREPLWGKLDAVVVSLTLTEVQEVVGGNWNV